MGVLVALILVLLVAVLVLLHTVDDHLSQVCTLLREIRDSWGS